MFRILGPIHCVDPLLVCLGLAVFRLDGLTICHLIQRILDAGFYVYCVQVLAGKIDSNQLVTTAFFLGCQLTVRQGQQGQKQNKFIVSHSPQRSSVGCAAKKPLSICQAV